MSRAEPCGTLRNLARKSLICKSGTPLRNLRNLNRKSLISKRRRKRKQPTLLRRACAGAHTHSRMSVHPRVAMIVPIKEVL
jgi:hypothetical protein